MNIAKAKAAEEKPDRKVVPAGVYDVTIIGTEEDVSKKGTPFLRLTLEVQNGPHKGHTFIERLYDTEAAAWKTRIVLEACGFDIDQLEDELPAHELKGRRAVVLIEHEDGQDRDGNPRVWENVKRWEPHPDGPGESNGVPPRQEADIPF